MKDQRREFPALINGHKAKNTAAKNKNIKELKDMAALVSLCTIQNR
jgi:hypothetical protein